MLPGTSDHHLEVVGRHRGRPGQVGEVPLGRGFRPVDWPEDMHENRNCVHEVAVSGSDVPEPGDQRERFSYVAVRLGTQPTGPVTGPVPVAPCEEAVSGTRSSRDRWASASRSTWSAWSFRVPWGHDLQVGGSDHRWGTHMATFTRAWNGDFPNRAPAVELEVDAIQSWVGSSRLPYLARDSRALRSK